MIPQGHSVNESRVHAHLSTAIAKLLVQAASSSSMAITAHSCLMHNPLPTQWKIMDSKHRSNYSSTCSPPKTSLYISSLSPGPFPQPTTPSADWPLLPLWPSFHHSSCRSPISSPSGLFSLFQHLTLIFTLNSYIALLHEKGSPRTLHCRLPLSL